MAIVLYHSPGSRSARITWLLEELGLAYEIVAMTFSRDSMKSPEYLAKNPLGLVPTLEDGDVVLFESGAIVEYLLERYGDRAAEPLAPAPGDAARPYFLQWLHWIEGSAMPPVSNFLRFTAFTPPDKQNPELIAGTKKLAGFALKALERELSQRDYIAGDRFSAADIMVAHYLGLASGVGAIDLAEAPGCAAHRERCTARPAAVRAAAHG